MLVRSADCNGCPRVENDNKNFRIVKNLIGSIERLETCILFLCGLTLEKNCIMSAFAKKHRKPLKGFTGQIRIRVTATAKKKVLPWSVWE